MSNEEFNRLTPAKLAQDNANELRQMIPSMQASITDMRTFQSFIVKELIETAKQLPDDIFTGVFNGQSNATPPPRNAQGALLPGIPGFLTPIITPNIQKELQLIQDEIDRQKTPARVYNAIEQYASQWIDPIRGTTNFTGVTLAIIQYLIDQRVKGNLFPELKGLGNVLLSWEKKLKPKKLTPQQQQAVSQTAINKSSTGVVNTIATLFNRITSLLAQTKQRHKSMDAQSRQGQNSSATRNIWKSNIKQLFRIISDFNIYVAKNRFPKLQIDQAKTIKEPYKVVRK